MKPELGPSAHDVNVRSARVGGALILITTALILTIRLGVEGLWLDETYTWWFSTMDWASLLQSVRIDGVNPPLYYLLTKVVAGSNPSDEAHLRLLSAGMHLLAVATAWSVGRRMGGNVGGLVTAAFWAVHPMSLWFALDARPYALTAGLSWLSLLLFLLMEGQDDFNLRLVLLGGLVVGAGLLSHYFFLVFCVGLTLLAILKIRSKPTLFRSWTLSFLLGFIPLGLWLAWYLTQPSPSLGIGWIVAPDLVDLPLTAWNLLSGYGGSTALFTGLFGAANLLILLTGADRRAFEILGTAFVPAIIGVWLLSQWRPVYVDRYFMILLPLLGIAIGRASAQVVHTFTERQWLQFGRHWGLLFAAAYAVLSLTVAVTMLISDHYRKEDYRGLVQQLGERPRSGEVLWLSEAELTLPMRLYAPEEWRQVIVTGEGDCGGHCYWLLRQPYTETHALSGAVTDADRPWLPAIPAECRQAQSWQGHGGVALWSLQCQDAPP